MTTDYIKIIHGVDYVKTFYYICTTGNCTNFKKILDTMNTLDININFHIEQGFYKACMSDNNLELVIYITSLYKYSNYPKVNIHTGLSFAINYNCVNIFKYLSNLHKFTDYGMIKVTYDTFRIACVAINKNVYFLKNLIKLSLKNPYTHRFLYDNDNYHNQ